MTTTTDGAARCRTLAGENTSAAPSVARRAAARRLAPLVVPLLALVLHATPHAAALLQFDRAALAHGQLWRLLTGHLVHFSTEHLLWDVGAFALLGLLLPPLPLRRWARLLGGAALAISAGVWLLQPQFVLYRGLSGIDCALFGAVLVARLRVARRERDRVARAGIALVSLGFLGKCAYELRTAAAVFVAGTDFTPVPLAHLLGAAAGALVATSPLSPTAETDC